MQGFFERELKKSDIVAHEPTGIEESPAPRDIVDLEVRYNIAVWCVIVIKPPSLAKQACLLYNLLLFLLFVYLFFYWSALETNYLRICKTDLCHIFRVVRHVGIDGQCDIRFVIAQWILP